MKKLILLGGLFLLILAIMNFGKPDTMVYTGGNPPENKTDQITSAPKEKVAKYEIKSGDTFAGIATSLRVPYDQAAAVINASEGIFDFTEIQAGKIIRFVFFQEALAAIEYPLDSETLVVVQKEVDGFRVAKEPIPYQVTITVAKGVITESLFAAAAEAGVEDVAILELADIFSSDIDFATDIQAGDSFSLVYEKRSLDGNDAGAGKVLAASFVNNASKYTAFRYDDKFYNENGESVTRQFLKSPLNYARISSGFSYKRTNPVTKQVTPHRAIDYAASAGTPVIATADGKVVTAGSKGGLGITVELKHDNYLTQYAHLSLIAKGVRSGVVVEQGDVIGYVGSTGISTGPHLQYAVFKGGNPINPLTAEFPRGPSLVGQDKIKFNEIVETYQPKLE